MMCGIYTLWGFSPIVEFNLCSFPLLKLVCDVSGGPKDVLNIQEELL